MSKNASNKKFRLKADEIMPLLPDDMGGSMASDRITVDGMPVGYMIRDNPANDIDNGWRFFAGDEDEDYCNNPDNFAIYSPNTIANYDPAIIPYLEYAFGTELSREANSNKFIIISQ